MATICGSGAGLRRDSFKPDASSSMVISPMSPPFIKVIS